ncbi:MAG TPA: tRNA lysidine(34) synthetase TilS [Xanthobacteraceae bacterium]|nr:tRNA lysidine(34) synthetase TilS [Xanthobacteraceae bacterium]
MPKSRARALPNRQRTEASADAPISAPEAKQLLAGFAKDKAVVLAVSGGPDSLALMWLAARWRRSLKSGPELIAVTVDHGLRAESAREARDVKRLAGELGITHFTRRWRGEKPETGLSAAARDARYQLLTAAARAARATCVVTAHTRDDQAETVLMRLARGSGIHGLGGMREWSPRDDVIVARPLLGIDKSRLIATLKRAGIAYAEDPTNRDARYTRPRLRALMPALAAEGCDARNLARLAGRLARANAALDLMTDGAERYLAGRSRGGSRQGVDAAAFAALAEEIRVRLLHRAVERVAVEGDVELGKVERLVQSIDEALMRGEPLKQTLAGALISVDRDRIFVKSAPPRRGKVAQA